MSPMSIELIANYCFLSDFGVKEKGFNSIFAKLNP